MEELGEAIICESIDTITPIDSRGTHWQNGWDCTKPREEELQTETQQHFPNWYFTALFCWAGNSSSPGGGGSCLPNWRSEYLAFPSVPWSSGFPVNKTCCLSLTQGIELVGGRRCPGSWSTAGAERLWCCPGFVFFLFSSSEANTIPEAEISPRSSGWPGHRTSPPPPSRPLPPQGLFLEPPKDGHWFFHGFHGIMQMETFWKWNQSLAAGAQGQKVWTRTAPWLSICQVPLPPEMNLSRNEKMKMSSFPKAALVKGGGWERGLEVLTGNSKQAFT